MKLGPGRWTVFGFRNLHFSRQDQRRYIGFDDPPKLAQTAHSEEESLDQCRRVRDEIREFVRTLPENLG